MSEMKEMIVEVVERMLKEQVDKELVDTVEQGQWAPKLWDLFEENGMTLVAVSEENGGAGGDIEDLLHVIRFIGKYAAPIPFAETTLANHLLQTAGLNVVDQLATYHLKQDAFTLESEATISGTAYNVPWARHTKKLVTLAKSNDRIHLVEVDLSQAELVTENNLAGEPRDTVIFHQAAITQASPALNEQQIHAFLTFETAFQIALMTGAIERANELSVQYSKEREQFGRPINRFQLVQQHIVLLAGETAVALAAFNNVTKAVAESTASQEVAYARIRIEEAIQSVATISHQVHAAIGTTHEHSLHQFTRRLWAWRDEGSSINYWSDLVAQQLIQSGDSLWAYLTTSKTALKL